VVKLPLNSTVWFHPLLEVVAIRKETLPVWKVAWYSPAFSKSTCVPEIDAALNHITIVRLLDVPGLKMDELERLK
jgi:hypothetical protein